MLVPEAVAVAASQGEPEEMEALELRTIPNAKEDKGAMDTVPAVAVPEALADTTVYRARIKTDSEAVAVPEASVRPNSPAMLQ